MPSLEEMEKDIEEMEKVFSNPEEENESATETENETEELTEVETTEEEQESIPEETTDTIEEQKTKKTREDWKKRFTKYKAATDATIHQLRVDYAAALEQNNGMFRRVQELVEEVRTLRDQISANEDIFSDEEKDVLGVDAINAIQKANKTLLEKQVKPLQEELRKRDLDVQKERELRAAQERERAYADFKAMLAANVTGDLEAINLDPKFAEWLNTTEPGTGVPRIISFRKAESVGDVMRVAGFFNEYEARKSSGNNLLEKKVTPTGKGTTATTHNKDTTKQNRIWTTSQIDAFMDDQIRGAFKGKESLEKEIEAEIKAAISSGRVRKG